MLKKSVFLAVALAIVFSLSACGPSPQEATPTPTPAPSPAPTPTPSPAPTAEFKVASLDIKSPEVMVGEAISITTVVENTGGIEGTYVVILTVDGVTAETKKVIIAPRSSKVVTFSLVKDAPGDYEISIGGLSSSVNVREKLSQEEKEFIEFLEAEDEQFDYPAINKVCVGFRVNYFYEHSGNSFTNQEVTGYKHWDADLWNLKDKSGEPIKGLGATFTTNLVATNYKKGQLTKNEKTLKIGPPVYVWSYGDIPQEEEHEAIFRPSPYVEFRNQSVIFTPGFDCSRSADKTIFTGPGVQTLTLTMILRDENIEKTAAGIFMCIYTVIPGGENLVDAIITSPTTDHKHIEVSEDRRSLRIYDVPAKTNTPWSINLTIEVTPKPGVSKAEFLPFTSFIWNCGSVGEPHDRGTTTGSSVSCAADSVGTWKWKAKGNYIWEWESGLCACLVAFPHLQERVEE